MIVYKTDHMSLKKKHLFLRYIGHIAFMTGKSREALSVEREEDISGVIARLDERYPGFKDVFIPHGGVFNTRTGIIIRRAGQPTLSVADEEVKVSDGDIITFW